MPLKQKQKKEISGKRKKQQFNRIRKKLDLTHRRSCYPSFFLNQEAKKYPELKWKRGYSCLAEEEAVAVLVEVRKISAE